MQPLIVWNRAALLRPGVSAYRLDRSCEMVSGQNAARNSGAPAVQTRVRTSVAASVVPTTSITRIAALVEVSCRPSRCPCRGCGRATWRLEYLPVQRSYRQSHRQRPHSACFRSQPGAPVPCARLGPAVHTLMVPGRCGAPQGCARVIARRLHGPPDMIANSVPRGNPARLDRRRWRCPRPRPH